MENLEQMTVAELRKLAKEHSVKLPAGIDKQGIINKLSGIGEEKPSDTQTKTEETGVRIFRKASIITDDIDEPYEEDGSVFHSPRIIRPAPAAPVTGRPAVSSGGSSLSTISSKAPAFTTEGARAWHNPRSYNPAPPVQSYARTQWTTKPVAAQDSPYTGRAKDPVSGKESPASHVQANPVRENAAGAVPSVSERYSGNTADRKAYSYQDPFSAIMNLQSGFAAKENAWEPSSADPSAPTPDMLMNSPTAEKGGFLDILPEGFGYLRVQQFNPGKDDILVSYAQIRRFELRKGDLVIGQVRGRHPGEAFDVLLTVTTINGIPADNPEKRLSFDQLSPIYPKRQIRLSSPTESSVLARTIDLLCPIGFGQRALIRTPSGFDSDAMLCSLSRFIAAAAPDSVRYFLCLGETPEDTGICKANASGSFIPVPFGTAPEAQIKICETVLENAMRVAELKQDAVIIVNDLHALADAYHACSPQSSRILYDDLSAAAVSSAKRFFAAARNTKEGGSVTVICACTEDHRIGEEFQNTANMLLSFDSTLQDKQIDPPLRILGSFTRHGEIMFTQEEKNTSEKLRNSLQSCTPDEAVQQLLFIFDKARTNTDLNIRLDSLLGILKR